MHTGVISFCDRIHFNVKCSTFKDELLKRLDAAFGLKIIARHWHRLDESGIELVTNPRAPHWMCFRSNGNPYYMVLINYEDVPMIVYIDKKIQPGYEYPRMLLGRGQFSTKAFEGNGTIFDGEMVKDTRNGWAFLINDVISYGGRALRHVNLKQRLAAAVEVLDGHVHDPYMDSCVHHIKRYFAPTQEGFSGLLETAAFLPYTHRGVYFWPDNYRFKPKLHNFDDTLIKTVTRKVKDEPEFREHNTPAPAQAPAPAPIAPTKATALPVSTHSMERDTRTPAVPHIDSTGTIMWLKKTENPDVYEVYPPYETGGNIKVGIAAVPSLTVSKMLRAVFKSRTIAQPAAFECAWHPEFQKYVPQRIIS